MRYEYYWLSKGSEHFFTLLHVLVSLIRPNHKLKRPDRHSVVCSPQWRFRLSHTEREDVPAPGFTSKNCFSASFLLFTQSGQITDLQQWGQWPSFTAKNKKTHDPPVWFSMWPRSGVNRTTRRRVFSCSCCSLLHYNKNKFHTDSSYQERRVLMWTGPPGGSGGERVRLPQLTCEAVTLNCLGGSVV